MDGQPTFSLHGSVPMPRLGLGTYKSKDGPEVTDAVRVALETGYRLIDTAAVYRNEAGVGEGIRASGVDRADIFVTTKVWNDQQGYDETLRAAEASLQRLGLDHLDLYLVHWPRRSRMADTWRALERLRDEGLTRAIGVSNFLPHHLDELMQTAEVAPALNQIELHPRLQQREAWTATESLGAVVQAWSPIQTGLVLDDPTIAGIAAHHEAEPAQVVLRWGLQSGLSVIPKSVHADRIRSNFDVFGFELTEDELAAIDALERGERTGPDPDQFPGD